MDGESGRTFSVVLLLAAVLFALLVAVFHPLPAGAQERAGWYYVAPPDDPYGHAGETWGTDDDGNFWPSEVVSASEPVYRPRTSSRGTGRVEDIIAAAFPAQSAKAIRVARCESSLDPRAYSAGVDRVYGPYSHIGIFQVEPRYHGHRAVRLFGHGASLFDPTVNAAVAAEIVRELGWQPWPVCKHA